jgi:hypothetical protein
LTISKTACWGAINRLIEAQAMFAGACERIEVYVKQRSGLAALDTLRRRPLADGLTAAIEGHWGFYGDPEEHPMPADERRGWIADVSIALSVLRTIAKAEEEKAAPEDAQI